MDKVSSSRRSQRAANAEIWILDKPALSGAPFLKEHRKVEQQEATIAQFRQEFAEQRTQIEALTAGWQKVSAQLELSKPAPQMVVNDE